jgi:hypothetical protein
MECIREENGNPCNYWDEDSCPDLDTKISMKRKITVAYGNRGYYEIEDIAEQYNDLLCTDMTQEEVDKYFAPGEYDGKDSNTYAYAFIEYICQSDCCPPFLFEDHDIKVIVEEIE